MIIQNPIIARLAKAFNDAGKELYLVGGIVRDMFTGDYQSKDIDMTTNALPQEIMEIVAQTHPIGFNMIGEKYGTIQVRYSHFPVVEITTYRIEHYPSGDRHPEVQFVTDLEEDLRRRDFNVNAIGMNARTGEIVDPFHGRAYIKMKRIGAVESAEQRFNEDPLRLLRAIRFAAQLDFSIASATDRALSLNTVGLARISNERIRDEFNKILLLPGKQAAKGINLLYEKRLLHMFLPEVADLSGVAQPPYHALDVFDHTMAVVAGVEPLLALRLAALLHDVAKPVTKTVEQKDGKEVAHFYQHEDVGAEMAVTILKRLRYSNMVIDAVERLIKMHMRMNAYTSDWGTPATRRLYHDIGYMLYEQLQLAVADGSSDRGEPPCIVQARMDGFMDRIQKIGTDFRLHPPKSPLDGRELMAYFGLGQGRWIQDMKDYLYNLVVDGELDPSDKERAYELARAEFSKMPK